MDTRSAGCSWNNDKKIVRMYSVMVCVYIYIYIFQMYPFCFAGSIPAGVSGFFIDIKSFRSHYGSGVDSASNRNEYQEHFLGIKAAGA